MNYLIVFYVIVVNNNFFYYVNVVLINLVVIVNFIIWLIKVFDCLYDKRYLYYIF